MKMNLIDLTIVEALEKLKAKEISATELTQAYLARIEKYGDKLNCYITKTPERALADADESDKRYADGTARPLEGIPIGMKDLFATKGIRTTAASKILENFIPLGNNFFAFLYFFFYFVLIVFFGDAFEKFIEFCLCRYN